MRIKSLYIKEYKILKDFYIDFHEDINTNVIIGKNGSGKTTLFEAIIHIFREPSLVNNVQYLKKAFKALKLEFEINYQCKGKEIHFSHIDDKLVWLADGNNILENDNLFAYHELFDNTPYVPKKILDFMPDHIITYYAGESDRITSLFKIPLDDAAKLLQKGKQIPLRQFLNVNTKDIRKVLVSLFVFNGIKSLDIKNLEEFQLLFKKPKWYTTAKNNFNKLEETEGIENAIEQFNPDFYFAEGVIGTFLENLRKLAYTGGFDMESEPHHVSQLYIKADDLTLLKESKINISDKIDLFKLLDHTKHSDLLEGLKLYFKIESKKDPIELSQFSEGEQQIKLVTGLFELFKNQETLFLFDEPDTYLHPEWQVKLFKTLLKASKSQTIVTSHSSIALALLKQENLFSMKKGKLSQIKEKPFAADVDNILFNVQNVLQPHSELENQDKYKEIIAAIDIEDFENAYKLLAEFIELNQIDEINSIISELKMRIRNKELFGE
ncbi:AAA family ATPase [Marinifilum sp.]|uniref:AAA family ATPase n=1 Tax=Marinifilum sp. TaxID=2033137 RepID=UPI003BAAC48C